ncbi:MAG: M36 family metallopeptidase [Bacteroidetes bacterium]|nr:M36 family metallopeptidase [Bacteroidota bacterium]
MKSFPFKCSSDRWILDNGIVTHEYGHGVSNRLTGGPNNSNCLSNGEQAGEGWSDWLALMFTQKDGDDGADARGVGTFALGEPTNGPGIRRYPYSTDMSINPETYGFLAASSEVHNVGEVWCTVVWDLNWALVDQDGFDPDWINGTSGNNIAMALVMEGMKLQPCGPGFLDGRDAILQADDNLYGGIHKCMIWEVFARRGMGFNASQGSANTAGDETEDFLSLHSVRFQLLRLLLNLQVM